MNLVHKFNLQNDYLDDGDPWEDILSATTFAVKSMYHTILHATSGQSVFGRNMILNLPFVDYWEAIMRRKQYPIDTKKLK